MAESDDMRRFYNDLQTVPKLVSDLALSIAEAQRRLDHDYLESLAQFVRVVASVAELGSSSIDPKQFLTLFQAMAPSRYQFTETALEVRADLQMGRMEELGVKVDVGLKTAVFAVAVNAAYAKRSAYDAHAAAVIRTTLNAIPADPGMLDKLLPRAGEVPHAPDRLSGRYKEIAEAFKELLRLTPPAETVTSP